MGYSRCFLYTLHFKHHTILIMIKITRVGLFGGSFDPVHKGHIRLALLAKKEFRLNKVIFIPAYKPPHKAHKVLTSPSHRLKMLLLAVKKYPSLSVSSVELDRKKAVYTYQTLEHFSRACPKCDLFFIVGSDSLAEMDNWKKPAKILELSRLIVGRRRNAAAPASKLGHERVFVLSGQIPPASSSEIRKKIKAGQPYKTMLPTTVHKHIKKHGLYI